jgi:pimeloyl-ACP methyl ester carboxylesterase
MLAPKRRSRWLARIAMLGGALVLCLVLLVGLGAVYQFGASRRDRRLNPPPGRLVNVGSFRMHIYCQGNGSPTVVFESGLGDTWLSWYRVQPKVAQFTRACSYDRAGMGWSDPSPNPRTSKEIATELHRLLQNAGVMAPLILVGHSLGGLDVRMYASLYRSDVVGMVLVDATPDHLDRFPQGLKKYNDDFLRKETLRRDTIPFGLARLMGWCGNGPAELRAVFRTVDCRLQPWREHLAEYRAEDESMAQVRATGSYGNMPLIVLSHPAGKSAKGMENAWNEAQKELTHLSTNSSQVIATGSGHNIQLDRPDLVVSAIRKIVARSAQSEYRNPTVY